MARTTTTVRMPRIRTARLVRDALVPLIVALPPLFWVADATQRAALTPLGRDQGIFQYVAWALRHGAVDYRDIHDVNGPLTHLVHLALLALGGADEHRFRVLDLFVSGIVFAAVGAFVPGWHTCRRPAALERAAWALAGWVVLSGQYLLYGYWDAAQRESFFDWFLLPSLALQLSAAGATATPWRFALAGALGAIPCFGKPTYVLFPLLQLGVIAVDDGLAAAERRRALVIFLGGAALGAASQVVFLLACGDVLAFLRTQLVDVPALYRFIWPRAVSDMFSDPWRATQALFAAAGAGVFLALVALGEMRRRAILLALAPLCAVAGVIAQRKAFPYHFHPVTATVHLQWLAFACWAGERTRVAARRRAALRLVPVGVGALLAIRVAGAMQDSPYIRAVWLLWGAATPEQRTTREYFAHFPEPDYFPFELHEAADYLRAHTAPTDRVQTYGMDPYVLFLAGRRSATPYIYAYDLDADAALAGGTGARPDASQAERIRAMRDRNEEDLLARLLDKPPAAFVFIDGSPLLSEADAWDDFEDHCPRASAWVTSRYREAIRFGHDAVWLPIGDGDGNGAGGARGPGAAPGGGVEPERTKGVP